MRTARALWITLLGLGGIGLSAPGRAQPEASFRIANVRIFDGERVVEGSAVAVERGVIRAVGPDVAQWSRLRVVDGAGGTLLPGLIDGHVHTHNAAQLREALRFGVTTVVDLGAVIEPPELYALRSTAAAASDMADLRVVGFLASARSQQERGGPQLPSNPQVATVDDARRFVSDRQAEGANHLKIVLRGLQSAERGVPNLDVPRVSELVSAAHANGLPAIAHVETLGDVDVALTSGVDIITHVWRREAANPEMARRVTESGTWVMPALAVPDGFLPDSRARLLAEPRWQSRISAELREHLGPAQTYLAPIASAPIEERRANVDAQLAALRSLRAAGARFVAGSDASRSSPVGFGISLHRELEILTSAGVSAAEALAAATSSAADAFRVRDRGRIAVGLRADLVLVSGDPTSDILATRGIERVWKAGVEAPRPD